MKSSTKNPRAKKNQTTQNNSYWLLIGLILVTILLATGIYAATYNYWYQGRIFPGIFVGKISVGGLSQFEARQKLNQEFDDYKQAGFNFVFADRKVKISPTIISPTDPDISYELLNWPTDQAAARAYQVGREKPWWENFLLPLTYRIKTKTIPVDLQLEKNKLKKILQDNFSRYETPPQNPLIIWSDSETEIAPEQAGRLFDYDQTVEQTYQLAKNLCADKIELKLKETAAAISSDEIGLAEKDFLQKLPTDQPSLTWKAQTNTHLKKFTDYRDQLIFARQTSDDLAIVIDPDWLTAELVNFKNKVDRPAHDAKFEVKDGRVVVFQESLDGLNLLLDENVKLINNNFLNNEYVTELKMEIAHAKIQTGDVNNLGISEVVGIGTSNFAGSPANRRHNIKIGADSLNGLLIKPGEEFSLLKALLPVDAAKGYLPELVIRGNRTIPEYGGGLCQIGTTSFRAALASGLPITQRQNHSYRVSYYEPAGTDATIYDPAPDFRFLNDTPGHILIQTKIEGDELIFLYWGTSDGRLATTTSPRIYNITAPPPTKYIETTDLEVGIIKCTEKPHRGADAEFTYTVTYPDGTIREKIFTSHYRPWQEVCLKGVEEQIIDETVEEKEVGA